MSLLDRVMKYAAVLSRWGAWLGGCMLIASVLLISFDVIGRKIFNAATNGSNEISGYILAISTSWALAFGVFEKINVRVDVLYRTLPLRVAAVLDLFAAAILELFIAVTTYFAFITFHTSLAEGATANTNLGTPLWIPQGLWLLGLVWMTIVLALVLVRALSALALGDHGRIAATCGPRDSTDEAEEEVRMAGLRAENQGVPT